MYIKCDIFISLQPLDMWARHLKCRKQINLALVQYFLKCYFFDSLTNNNEGRQVSIILYGGIVASGNIVALFFVDLTWETNFLMSIIKQKKAMHQKTCCIDLLGLLVPLWPYISRSSVESVSVSGYLGNGSKIARKWTLRFYLSKS